MITKPHLLIISIVLFLAFVSTGVSSSTKPNIIFVLADDLGYGDIGVLWQNQRTGDKKIRTPFIDQMAEDGMILNRHYCPAPVCAPSRASLLTGLHQGHANVRDNQFDKALEDNHNLASVLKKAGYFTAIIGKYGLQGKKGNSPKNWSAYPTKRGFDYFFGYVQHSAGHTHYPHHKMTRTYGNKKKVEKTADLYDQDKNISSDLSKCFTPDLFTARAKKLIYDEVHDGDDQPFFLYLAYDTPHAALQLPTVAYPGINIDDPTDDQGLGVDGGVQWIGKPGQMINTAIGEVDAYRHPDHTTKVGNTWSDVEERQAGLVRRMDDNIGDIRKTLKDLGIEKNTVIVFSSDNGPHSVSYMSTKQTRDAIAYEPNLFESFGPFEGIKRDCWEGGIREPSFAVWPDKIAAGSQSEQISQFHDWLPTFCDIAGLPYPARTDGVSLLPALTGQGEQKETTTYIEYNATRKGKKITNTPDYPEFKNHRNASRTQAQVIFLDGYKGIRHDPQDAQGDFAIYDVRKDLSEGTNLTKTSSYFESLNERMKRRVLQIRMPDPAAPRSWDNAPVPAVENISDLRKGLTTKSYQGNWDWIPEFTVMKPQDSTTIETLNSDQFAPLVSAGGVLCEGYINVPTTGKWTFVMKSNSKSFLRIHDKKAIDNDYNYRSGKLSVSIHLEAGYHPIRLYVVNNPDRNSKVSLKWESENEPLRDIELFSKPAAQPIKQKITTGS